MGEINKKHNAVLQSARQIFSIAINCLQQLHNIKDGNSMGENLGETIENYKVQLGKYHKILLSEGADRSELFSEAVMMEHKKKLIAAKEENNLENIIEVLLSLRVNALQISPELRKNLVYELIRNDIFLISGKKNNAFVLELLSISSHALKHALCALVSVIVSTLKGVEYLVENDQTILQKIIDVFCRRVNYVDFKGTRRWKRDTAVLRSDSPENEHQGRFGRYVRQEQDARLAY